MKVSFWTWIKNAGDGSVYIKFFSTKDEAENAAKTDDERFCDDIERQELDFDQDGKLMNGDDE